MFKEILLLSSIPPLSLSFSLSLYIYIYSNYCSLRSCAKDMTITIVIINPRLKMGPECGWCHAQKRCAENLEDFEKDSVEFRPWCGEVGVRPCSWGVGVRPCSWGFEIWTMQADNWASAIGAENGVLCHRVEFSTVVADPDQRRWIEI